MAQGTQLDVEYTSYDAEDDILGPADVLDSSSEEEDEARADDDQLQLRSILNATEGLTRKHNPRKRYGPQQDVWCSFATGAVISAHVISSLQMHFLHRAHASAHIEVGAGLFPDHLQSRPADILLQNWNRGRPVALDISVVSP
eukprot:Em0004g1345a